MLGGELINLTEQTTDSNGDPVTADTLYWMAGDNTDGQLENLTVVLTTATGTVFAPVAPDRGARHPVHRGPAADRRPLGAGQRGPADRRQVLELTWTAS